VSDGPFRDDAEAAIERADALDRENAELRRENEKLRASRRARSPSEQKPPKQQPAPRRRRIPLTVAIPGVVIAAVVALPFVVVHCHKAMLYTDPGKPSDAFVANGMVVIVDDVAIGGNMGKDATGSRVTVLDGASGRKLGVRIVKFGGDCWPGTGAVIWCEDPQPTAFVLPDLKAADSWTVTAKPDGSDETCKHLVPLEKECQHAEMVGGLLVVIDRVAGHYLEARDPETGRIAWSFAYRND
jgi:hypothetical protein